MRIIITCNMNRTTEITEQLYVDNEFNNLQAIATHDRFVEGVEIVHLEEFVKFDMDLLGSEVVILWDL